MNFYIQLGKVAHILALPMLKIVGKNLKPRVRSLVISKDGHVLLVRSWFGYQRWSLPGGGIGPHEAEAKTATRETLEETGIFVPANSFTLFGEFTNTDSAAAFKVRCYVARDAEKVKPRVVLYRRLEVLEAGWFPIDALPKNRSSLVDQVLATR